MNGLKLNFLIVILIVISCKTSYSSDNITIETKSDNLFENIASDTLLLLDPNLKKIIASDFDHVVTNSKFQLQVNSWKPRQSPNIKLAAIYNNINSTNIRESFAFFVQPVVELACTPQRNDPLNEIFSKCIKELFRYPIIETIKISYVFKSNMTFEQNIANLSNLNDKYRYHQIVWTLADIMNSAYGKVSNKNVTKNVNFVKYPLALVAPSVASSKNFSDNDKVIISNEKADLESQISRKRMECHNSQAGGNDYCYKKKKELEVLLDELERNPEYYFEQKPVREAKAQAKYEAKDQAAQVRNTDNNSVHSENQQQQYFMTNGGMMTQPPGSFFATTTKGETYFKPEGSAFSYGTGANAGKNCFHYGAFADCK